MLFVADGKKYMEDLKIINENYSHTFQYKKFVNEENKENMPTEPLACASQFFYGKN